MASDDRDERIDRTTAEVAVGHLQAAYGDAVTRRAWPELDDLFLPDCPIRLDLRGRVVELVGPAELGRFVGAAVERFSLFLFTIQSSVIDVDPGASSASARLTIRELRQERDPARWTSAYGLYRDTYRCVDGVWRFASRDYATLARTSADGTGMDVWDVPPR